MNKKKFIMCMIIATMTTTSCPVRLFAAQTTTSQIRIVESEKTTESALSVALEQSEESSKICLTTNLVNVSGNEVTNKAQLSYEWNDEWFFEDNTLFNVGLSKTAAIFSTLANYSSEIDKEVNGPDAYADAFEFADDITDINNTKGIMEVMQDIGLEDAAEYNLRSYYNDTHLIQFNVGHKKIKKGETEKDLVLISIRGSRGQGEWLSNFDMGTDEEFGATDEWTEKDNHRGFDITANRVVKLVEAYMRTHNIDSEDIAFTITGHSRGAGVANLVSKKIEDKGFDTYTYTFATPNVTLDENATSTYPSIFNIINKDDLVPLIPANAWGFSKYGRILEAQMDSETKKQWNKICNEKYSTAYTMNSAANAIAAITDNRNDASSFDKKGTTFTKTFYSEEKRKEALASIPEACLVHAKIKLTETEGLFGIKKYNYEITQFPMYFLTVAGLNLAGTMSAEEFVKLEVANKYKEAKYKLILAGIGGLSHPHYLESYILLTYNTDFNGVEKVKEESTAQVYTK